MVSCSDESLKIKTKRRKASAVRKENKTMRKYEKQAAADFVEAIKLIADKPDNLDNLESYLSRHFSEWVSKWANTPEGLAAEMKEFAEMEI